MGVTENGDEKLYNAWVKSTHDEVYKHPVGSPAAYWSSMLEYGMNHGSKCHQRW